MQWIFCSFNSPQQSVGFEISLSFLSTSATISTFCNWGGLQNGAFFPLLILSRTDYWITPWITGRHSAHKRKLGTAHFGCWFPFNKSLLLLLTTNSIHNIHVRYGDMASPFYYVFHHATFFKAMIHWPLVVIFTTLYLFFF